MDQSILVKRVRVSDIVITAAIYAAASLSILLLAGIVCYTFVKGISSISWQFLTTVPSSLKGTFGIAGNLLNTLYIVVITLVIATPIGVGSASIIFGLFGMVFFGNTLGLGYSIITGALTLTLMVLPLITRNTQEALKTVPESYRSGALGMGAARWYMIRTILLPSAMPGIITGIILAVGRIVGESAALLFTAGSGFLLPKSGMGFLTKILESGGTLTIQLYLCMSKAQYGEAFGIAVVLLVLVLLINMLTKYLSGKFNVETRE